MASRAEILLPMKGKNDFWFGMGSRSCHYGDSRCLLANPRAAAPVQEGNLPCSAFMFE